MNFQRFLLTVLFTICVSYPVHAEKITAYEIPKDLLSIQIEPLSKSELRDTANRWSEILKEKLTEISKVEIAIFNDPSKESALSQKLDQLETEKTEIIARFRIVLDALDMKGGDSIEDRKYISAVEGIETDVRGLSTRIEQMRAWFVSESGGIKLGLNSLKFVSIIIVFWILSAFTKRLIAKTLNRQAHLSTLLKDFINKISRRLVFLIGLLIALGTVGVNIGAALALIGGSAFIIGLALQDTLSNFANGIMLIIYRPFDVGSAVEVDGIRGKVDSVCMVNTTLLTFDNQKVMIPNKKVWGNTITNITGMRNRRVDLLFGIGYGDDIEKAQSIIENIVSENTLILSDPKPNIGLHELADSSVNIRCWVWAATSDYLAVKTGVMQRVKHEFDTAGISIPYPQQDIHLHKIENPI